MRVDLDVDTVRWRSIMYTDGWSGTCQIVVAMSVNPSGEKLAAICKERLLIGDDLKGDRSIVYFTLRPDSGGYITAHVKYRQGL